MDSRQDLLEAFAFSGHTHPEVLVRLRELGLPTSAIRPILDAQGGYFFRCTSCKELFLRPTSRARSYCSSDCSAKEAQLRPRKTWTYDSKRREEIVLARARTNQERYGVNNVFQSEAVKAKSEKSNLERYGVKRAAQSPEVRARIIATNLQRYGYESPSQSDTVKSKTLNTVMEKYGEVSPILHREVKALAHTRQSERRSKRLESARAILDSWKGEKMTFARACSLLGLSKSRTFHVLRELNYESNITWHRSIVNSDWADLIAKELGVQAEHEGRIFTNKRNRADLVFPEYRIAIDINPTITHSTQVTPASRFFGGGHAVSTTYHRDRALDAYANGWRLIQIFDWYDTDRIIDILRAAFKMETTRVFARQCRIVTLSAGEAKDFLATQHLQGGKAVGNIRYGLVDSNDRLCMVMTFSKARFRRSNASNVMEIIRLASDGIVVGGASRLFKHFLKSNPDVREVMTYADLSLGHGDVYLKLGFVEDRVAGLNAYYAHIVTGEAHKTTTLSQGKLYRLFPDADRSLSQREVMNSNKFYRINDAGHLIYRFTKGN